MAIGTSDGKYYESEFEQLSESAEADATYANQQFKLDKPISGSPPVQPSVTDPGSGYEHAQLTMDMTQRKGQPDTNIPMVEGARISSARGGLTLEQEIENSVYPGTYLRRDPPMTWKQMADSDKTVEVLGNRPREMGHAIGKSLESLSGMPMGRLIGAAGVSLSSGGGEGVIVERKPVSTIASTSKDGSKVLIDPKVPDELIEPVVLHEKVERAVIDKLMQAGYTHAEAYPIAHHQFAEPIENRWYTERGINVDDVNKFWAGLDKQTEKQKPSDDQFEKPGRAEGTKNFEEHAVDPKVVKDLGLDKESTNVEDRRDEGSFGFIRAQWEQIKHDNFNPFSGKRIPGITPDKGE